MAQNDEIFEALISGTFLGAPVVSWSDADRVLTLRPTVDPSTDSLYPEHAFEITFEVTEPLLQSGHRPAGAVDEMIVTLGSTSFATWDWEAPFLVAPTGGRSWWAKEVSPRRYVAVDTIDMADAVFLRTFAARMLSVAAFILDDQSPSESRALEQMADYVQAGRFDESRAIGKAAMRADQDQIALATCSRLRLDRLASRAFDLGTDLQMVLADYLYTGGSPEIGGMFFDAFSDAHRARWANAAG